MVVDPISATALAIAIVDDTVNVVLFLKEWIDKSKRYGDDVRIMRKQVTIESARLQSFSRFLKHKLTSGRTRFEILPEIHQNAIVGMSQELEIVFLSYSAIVKKYRLEDLQRGYELEIGEGTPLVGEALAKEGLETSKEIQKKATKIDKAVWGLFKRKKLSQLIMNLESWNNKLMNFLLCGIYFLENPDLWTSEGKEIV